MVLVLPSNLPAARRPGRTSCKEGKKKGVCTDTMNMLRNHHHILARKYYVYTSLVNLRERELEAMNAELQNKHQSQSSCFCAGITSQANSNPLHLQTSYCVYLRARMRALQKLHCSIYLG